ncbi:MAG: T9SS type A sorting domain-containing protein [Gracilimonas sp.]
MGFLLTLIGVLGFIAPTSDTTSTDTLYIFNPVDSVYTTEIISVSYDQSLPVFSSGHFIPSHRTEKILPSIGDVQQDDGLFFSDFTAITDSDEDLYPLSAVVKLFTAREDTVASRCSGLMVSPRHVLTAAHCIYFRDSLYSEVYAYAGYHNNGINNPGLLSKTVKYYTTFDFHKENVLSNDIALIELDSGIGYQSGWLGIGYLNAPVSDFFKENLTYTYGYPADTSFVDSSIVYDGEAMIGGFGYAELGRILERILIYKVGTPGQSGSSIFINHEQLGYFSLGTLTMTTMEHISFQKLTATTFFAFNHVIKQTSVSIEENPALAKSYRLHQNYPNPFNPSTTIPFELNEAGRVSLSVYNVTGQKMADLLTNERKTRGYHTITFNAGELSSGMYLYVLKGENFRESKKLLLIK